ncbi:DUF4190 domain-containing protein [Bacillus massiliglaciei]|uniref:DUF4190 domain-containing protein n=1 Tax=Bacillus massiliglaciei TaxID=1816693 RepID=UPI000DA63667|nr:DUF4190 domain-containing protein [Bacillus massiliglaciei]
MDETRTSGMSEKSGSEDTAVTSFDDQKHERYYNESDPADNRSFEGEKRTSGTRPNGTYREETSAELSAPVQREYGKSRDTEEAPSAANSGMGWGLAALAASILSLFMVPFILGIVGIVVGFVARSKGAKSMGAWAIGIGIASILTAVFIMPFF